MLTARLVAGLLVLTVHVAAWDASGVMSWAHKYGIIANNVAIELIPNKGHGLVLQQDAKRNSILCFVPKSKAVHLKAIIASDPILSSIGKTIWRIPSDGFSQHGVSLVTLKEKQMLILSIYLLFERSNLTSQLHPWLEVMQTGNLSLPFSFLDDEFDPLRAPTDLPVFEDLAIMDSEILAMCRVLRILLTEISSNLNQTTGWTFEDARWAYTAVASRAWAAPNMQLGSAKSGSSLVLLPMMDFVNNFQADRRTGQVGRVRFVWRAEDGTQFSSETGDPVEIPDAWGPGFGFALIDDTPAGTELEFQYHEKQLSNGELLAAHGFVFENNTMDIVPFGWSVEMQDNIRQQNSTFVQSGYDELQRRCMSPSSHEPRNCACHLRWDGSPGDGLTTLLLLDAAVATMPAWAPHHAQADVIESVLNDRDSVLTLVKEEAKGMLHYKCKTWLARLREEEAASSKPWSQWADGTRDEWSQLGFSSNLQASMSFRKQRKMILERCVGRTKSRGVEPTFWGTSVDQHAHDEL